VVEKKRRVLHSCFGVELARDLIPFSNATYDSGVSKPVEKLN
jgi:hypothetical protein